MSPTFIEGEIEKAVLSLKEVRAAGHDRITNKYIKFGGRKLIKILTKLFNEILVNKNVPQSWKTSNIILIFKKGKRWDIQNFRPMSLIPTYAKILSALLDFCLRGAIELQQSPCQTGFRRGFSTVNHSQTINVLIQKASENRITVHMAFIEFTKAFDLLNQNYMLKVLQNHGISTTIVKIIQEMCTDLKAKIITDIEGQNFNMRRGVRQGDPLSPLLFNCALNEIVKNLNWKNKGININGEFLSNLSFADDVVIVAGRWDDLQTMMEKLN